MSLQRRSSHTGGCLIILFTVVILMVCSAPILENNEKLVVNIPIERHLHSSQLNPPAESWDLNSDTFQHQLERHKNIPTSLEDYLEEGKVNAKKKKHTLGRSPSRLRKLVKRSEEKANDEDQNNEEKGDQTNEEKEEQSNEEKEEVKREEKDEDKEDEDDWGAKSGAHPAESDSNSQEAEKNGISPVQGPYLNNSASADDKVSADEESSGKHDHAHTFRNWEEYLQAQNSEIRKAVSNKPEGRSNQLAKHRKPAYRPVIHSDDHFRFMDKLFKAKNDKVKAFHALVLYMKQQGKSFKIPQRPTANDGNGPDMGNGTKPPK